MDPLKAAIENKKLKENPDLVLKKETEETNEHLQDIKERMEEPFKVEIPAELTEKAAELATVADFVVAFMAALRGEKGDKGEKGDTGERGPLPVKGKDYFTEEDVEAFLRAATPKKGEDYFDGEPGAPGRSPFFLGKNPPENPVKGDIWYMG
jgi:hypothetical protein